MEDIGIDDFIAKPVDIGILLQRIHDKLQLNWITSDQEHTTAQMKASSPQIAPPSPALAPLPSLQPINAERTLPETAADVEKQNDLPDMDDLKTLHELGSLGYIRGILEKLDELEQIRPDLAQVVHHLRAPVQQFHLGEYLRLLKQLEAKHEHT